MKYTELHRIILQNGWTELPGRGKGSHKEYEDYRHYYFSRSGWFLHCVLQ